MLQFQMRRLMQTAQQVPHSEFSCATLVDIAVPSFIFWVFSISVVLNQLALFSFVEVGVTSNGISMQSFYKENTSVQSIAQQLMKQHWTAQSRKFIWFSLVSG